MVYKGFMKMSKKPNDLYAKEFGKRSQNTRLDIIVRECRNCLRETAFIYMGKGDYKHVYQCLSCNDYVKSNSKLR